MGVGFKQNQWTPTPRRGPIAAEMKSPGPALVDLPPLLGYKKIAESSRPTAASFSFGKRHTHISRDDTVGPGPAEYDVSGLGSKGKVIPREITLASRPLPRKQFQTPAPGEYNVDKLDKSKLQSGGCIRGYTFGHPNPSIKSSHTPAPNEYKIPSVLGCSKEGKIKSAPAYTIIGRAKPSKSLSANFPGPGMYDGNFELLIKKPPQYSMGDRVGKTNNKLGPGPGAHSPEKINLSHVPAYSFGIKHSPYLGQFPQLNTMMIQ